MRALLATAAAAASAHAEGSLFVLTAATPPGGIPALLGAEGLGLPLLFAPGLSDGGHPLAAIGFGEAACVEGAGAGRFDAIAEQGAALLDGLIEIRGDGCESAPPPRLYGGLRFTIADPCERARDATDPWTGFPDARFVLPRWIYCEQEGTGFLQLAVSASALRETSALLAELSTLEAALHHPAPSREIARASVAQLDQEPGRWRALVGEALAQIAAGRMSKVVLSRRCELCRLDGARFDVAAALSALGSLYPECLRFALPVGEAVFLGATPELLIARRGNRIAADALAGSAPRRSDPDADRRAAAALLASDKERREHLYVVAALFERLAGFADEIDAGPQPGLRSLRNVHHLFTPVRAELRRPAHVLEILGALHPTPAVCGVPSGEAAGFVAQNEDAPRGFYAAPVGWFDRRGDGAFYVAIRSAVVRTDRAWLFAGAGIVAGSDPEREYDETVAKLQPMLTALQAVPADPP